MEISYRSIGTMATPFREKFGVPRQSLMMSAAKGVLKLNPDPDFPAALRHLEQFSHIWVLFVFHKNRNIPWHPLIETPRVDVEERIGVFATRSPDRPNSIGMSALKLERIDWEADGGIEIHLSGVDILDGTPVLDIKPYLPYADRIDEANSGWAHSPIESYSFGFSEESRALIEAETLRQPGLKELIEQMLQSDPRPISQKRSSPLHSPSTEGMKFAFRIGGLDVQWELRQGLVYVYRVLKLKD